MQLRNEHHTFTGMQRDTSPLRQPSSFLYEGYNIRLTPRDGDTMYAITNEKGTVNTNVTISGKYLGHCLLNEYLVVFSKGSTDFITKINLRTLEKAILFQGPLGFSLTYPIEAIGSYENENIQKVYWTDGLNQPRFINIVGDTSGYNKDSFDFTPAIELGESISVTKILGAGEFPAGVIQYAFTYFNRYGAETNIFYTTPLLYISYSDRGGSPKSKIANSFKISISNPDNKFDYLRIYSILRTSLNGTPIVKRVQDIEVHGTYTTVDSGYMSIVDAVASFSIDGGATYMSITELENATGKKIRYSMLSDGTIPVPNTYAYSPSGGDYEYVFNKSDFPNLYIKNSETGNLYRVTWGDDLNDTAVLYWSPTDLFCVCEYQYQSGGSWVRGAIKKYTAQTALTYTDTGLDGESVDPAELLYKGGEEIIAKTIEQKDGTLFLGNIVVARPHLNIEDSLLSLTGATKDEPIAINNVVSTVDTRYFDLVSKEPFSYLNTLSNPEGSEYAGASCFKSREYYRLGVQFQYKNGKWSEPYWIGDKQCLVTPSISNNTLTLPIFQFTLNSSGILSQAYQNGYRRVRPVFAIPRGQDKTILCQGVGCPTMYRNIDRYANGSSGAEGTLYAQSSWLFRVRKKWTAPIDRQQDTYKASNGGGKVTVEGKLVSQFDEDFYLRGEATSDDYVIEASPMLASTEVMGLFDDNHAFIIDEYFMSIHSPETVFDDSFQNMDFKGCQLYNMGTVKLTDTYGDIDIQTSSPAIGSDSGGFIHRSIKTEGYAALVSGPFYNDYIVNDTKDTPTYGPYNTSSPPVDWPIFMWHKNGSLNNDVARSGRSAELLKKKISNYRLGGTTTYTDDSLNLDALDIQLFSSDELSMIKVNGHSYRGNIETMVTPTTPSPFYIVGSPWRDTVDTDSNSWFKLMLKDPNNTDSKSGIWVFEKRIDPHHPTHPEYAHWSWWWDDGPRDEVGKWVKGLDQWREGISIKYKSTPHLVAQTNWPWYKKSGGELSPGEMPLMEIRKAYNKDTIFGGTSDEALSAHTWIPCGPPVAFTDDTTSVTLDYKWGDSYFQRYECLKTYAFTPEDKNQVIEIASFMVESRTNIDGRYDRNRGQTSNLNMSPQNFNLLNPVYSQLDTFFNYRILDKEYYKVNTFHNQITWSKEKQSGAETDTWTEITLASVYDMDGSKGRIVSLNTWRDQIFCFQTKGISNILFNSRVQIPASDGLPIEITNSYKVDGYRYLSDGIGCNDGKMIKETPSGIYFIDSVSNHLFHIADGIGDISVTHNMTSWFKGNNIYKLVYDDINHDLYILAYDQALCYSEILGQFVSFMDYNGIFLMETCNNRVFSLYSTNGTDGTIYGMFEGNYNYFFSSYKPWLFTFISNGVDESVMDFDKIFSTIDYRMDMKSGYTPAHDNTLNAIRVQTEYQDTGYVDLVRYKVVNGSTHLYDKTKNLEKKFRIWRIQIPRNQNSMDRIRNPWCKITLGNRNTDNTQAVLHDLNVQYYM